MVSENNFYGQDLLGKCKGDKAKEKSLKAYLSHLSSLVIPRAIVCSDTSSG